MDIVEYLRKRDDLIDNGAIDDTVIDNAEKKIGTAFADDYRSVISNFGQLSVGFHDFYGITQIKLFDVVLQTEAYRKKNPLIPNNMYVIEDAGIDRIMVLQDNTGLIYASQPGQSPVEIANSLMEYLKRDEIVEDSN